MRNTLIVAACTAIGLLTLHTPVARAAEPKVEVGGSLASATVSLETGGGTTFGIPSGGFGIINPGVYASLFVAPKIAVEPQLGLIWVSSDGHSEHIVNFAGQVDYFVNGNGQTGPFVFGSAGVVDVSGSGTTPKSLSVGGGLRAVPGDGIVLRADARFTHITDNGGNMLSFTLSIGGLFGQR
jgi:hypothetical protein